MLVESISLQINSELKPYEVDFNKLPRSNLVYIHKMKVGDNIYRGQVQAKRPFTLEGVGVMVYPDGKIYEGFWKNGLRSGHGRLVYTNGSVYTGDWANDLTNGYGVFSNAVGYRYEGMWKDDTLNGTGCETWEENGSRF